MHLNLYFLVRRPQLIIFDFAAERLSKPVIDYLDFCLLLAVVWKQLLLVSFSLQLWKNTYIMYIDINGKCLFKKKKIFYSD